MDATFLEGMWRTNALAGFFFAKAAIEAMLPRQRGVLIFTGASASLRGCANFGGFASAKAALRALVQSAAREFGPQVIHVAHVIVDGAIDGDRINTLLPALKAQRSADGLLDPDAIADNFWHLYCLDARDRPPPLGRAVVNIADHPARSRSVHSRKRVLGGAAV